MQFFKNTTNIARSILLVAFTYAVFVSCSKEEEPAPEPPKVLPEITSISPVAGFVGMHVVIAGKNFSKVAEENVVKFAGIAASVVDADENSIEVIVPPGGATGTVSVKANDGTATGPSFKYYDLFFLGNQIVTSQLEPSKNYVRYWRNGIVSDISDQSKYYYGTAFTVSGDDVFISGHHFDGQTIHPVYWKNTQVHPLSTGMGNASDISVVGNDTYVSGIYHNGTSFIAMYWKNGSGVELSEGLYSNDDASSIDVVDGNVFVGGALSTSGMTSKAALWKNESNEQIDNVLESSNIADVEVVGQDVHLVGRRFEGSKVYITYWKNGAATDITNGEYSAEATSISVIGGDVYITGYENTSAGKSQGKVWNVTKNEVTNVTDPTVGSIAYGLVKIDDMLVVCGERSTNQGSQPFYTVNGEYFPITEMGSTVAIRGVFVK